MAFQEQSETVIQFKRKQIIIAVFLICFVLTTSGFLLYFAYDLMKGGNSGENNLMGKSPIKMPASSLPSIISPKQHNDRNYFIYGEFSETDKKYKLYKVHYKEFAKEEIFSFPWSNENRQPEITIHEEHIAVFPSVNNGFFINHDGHPASVNEFIPPSRYFSISPDGKKILYFKYLSSLGNTMLVARDLQKDQDIYNWPLNSPASEVCDFAGWSADGAKSYCLKNKNNTATVKVFDIKNHSYSVIASVNDTADAKYYPSRSILLTAEKTGVYVYHSDSGERRQIISAPENTTIKNAFLTADGSKILYTATVTNNIIYADKIYSVNLDGTGQKELMNGKNANLISLSPNTQDMLFESPDASNQKIEHYFTGNISGESSVELFITNASVFNTQFIGWFVDNTAPVE